MKIKYINIAFVFMIITCVNVPAQDMHTGSKPSRAIELATGYIQLKEANLHGRVFHGISYTASYSSIREGKNITIWHVEAGNSHLQTTLADGFSSMSAVAGLEYSHLFRISHGSRWLYHAGPAAALRYSLSFFEEWDESHLYWANSLGLELSQRAALSTGRDSRLVGTLSIPVFLILSRPDRVRDYKMDDFSFGGLLGSFHSKPEFRLPFRAAIITGTLEYQFSGSTLLRPDLVYRFSFRNLNTSNSNSARDIRHHIGFKWSL